MAVCLLVIGFYVCVAQSGSLELMSLDAAGTYYNLLVRGFRSGQLSLKKDAPPGLARLADPYNPTANAPFRPASNSMVDMSYYKGRLYLYFGVTPALILFWPFTALTGHYLLHRQAVAVFCALGFLASVGLLRALWRRYFAEVNVGVVAACALALGLVTGLPVLMSRSDVYEVPISCGYMLTMLALGAIWRALHKPPRHRMSASGWFTTPGAWLAAASVAYGLAVGARPNLLFGAVILLAPVIHAWRERRPTGVLLTAATVPILLIGLGLMLYNVLRFGNPFELGGHYQLGPVRMDTAQYFSLHYLWFNVRVYFLEPARWSSRFPFVHDIVLPRMPTGHHGHAGEEPFGVLTNMPLVWLAPLGAGLAWHSRSVESGSILRRFLSVVILLLGICALTLCLFFVTAVRYEMEFLPELVLLAVVGILALERALTDRPVWRRVARWGWGLLLGFSVALNLLASVGNYAEGVCCKGTALLRTGKLQDAIQLYERALRIMPDLAEGHNDLGVALEDAGKLEDAVEHLEQAVRLAPGRAEAHCNLGNALLRLGRIQEAIGHCEQALRINPDYAEAQNNLGLALRKAGKIEEAIGHYEQALRINPDYPVAHYNLGMALEQAHRIQEAIGHYEKALQIKPDFAGAQNRLAQLRVVQ